MKTKSLFSKLLALVAAMVMVFAMAVPAMAAGSNSTTDTGKGSITIEEQSVSASYKAYKIFDVTYDTTKTPAIYAYSIAGTSPWLTAVQAYINQTGDEGITLTKTSGANTYTVSTTSTFSAADFAKYLKSNYINTDGSTKTITDTATTFTASGTDLKASNLALGYWFVTTTTGSLCNLTTTDPDAEIYDKNDIPFDKTEDKTSADVGETVTYTLTGKVPSTTGYSTYTYKVDDTLSTGLTFNKDVKIVFSDGTTNTVVVKPSDDYEAKTGETLYTGSDPTAPTVNYNPTGADAGKSFTVEFDMTKWQTYVNQDITITYTATVNSTAITQDEANNKATLTYSNDPTNTSSTDTKTDEEHLYSFNIVVDKVVTGATTTKLSGAEFALYKTETPDGGTATNYYYKVDNSKNVSWVTLETDKTAATDTNITRVTTDTNGAAEFDGLKAGTYYLVETKAPDGYTLLKDPITIVLKVTAQTEQTEPYKLEATVASETATVAHKIDNKITEATETDTYDNDVTAQVGNTAGSLLPSTGGIGTTIFYVIGGVLIAGAAILLISRRRRAQ